MDKSMIRYILKRLLISAITLFVILTVLFIMTRCMPGSPFNSEKLSPEQQKVIMAKYGLDCFSFTIVEECGKDELDAKEKYWIDYFNSKEKGLNTTSGNGAGL